MAMLASIWTIYRDGYPFGQPFNSPVKAEEDVEKWKAFDDNLGPGYEHEYRIIEYTQVR